ncbi:NAD(P)H-dependent oxidoreductase [Persicobacter psychrovividus]|uniref:Flavodoxin-like fold domain-containing protein n=1 Tax=Persicobacter psychrovividus TaxID=387638 RepID=A0ABM7VJC3_9BACT|nr:hypothetical protein PEPS_33660 [Persicobacter psychrovividus]
MGQLLVILAHPSISDSIANKTIVEGIQQKYPSAEVRDLTALYPDFKIDVAAEQQALKSADTVIFQYPFFWYNMPGILKHWCDEVLTFNFAYGPEGDQLKGKNFMASFTIGGPQDAYKATGYNHFRIEEFMKPIEQTAHLTQMNYFDPVYTHGMVYIEGVYNTVEGVTERAQAHLDRLFQQLDNIQG